MKRLLAGFLCFTIMLSNLSPYLTNTAHAAELSEVDISEGVTINADGSIETIDTGSEETVVPEEETTETLPDVEADSAVTDESETTPQPPVPDEGQSEDGTLEESEESSDPESAEEEITEEPEEKVLPEAPKREALSEEETLKRKEELTALIKADNFSYDEFVKKVHDGGFFYHLFAMLEEELRNEFYGKLSEKELYAFAELCLYEYLIEMTYEDNPSEELVGSFAVYADLYVEALTKKAEKKDVIASFTEEEIKEIANKNLELFISHMTDEEKESFLDLPSFLAYLDTDCPLDILNFYVQIGKINVETEDSLKDSLKGFKEFLYATYGFDVPVEETKEPSEPMEEETTEEEPEVEEELPVEDEIVEEEEEVKESSDEIILEFKDYDWDSKEAYLTLNVDETEREKVEELLPEEIDIVLDVEELESQEELLTPAEKSGVNLLGLEKEEDAEETENLDSTDLLKKTVTLPVTWSSEEDIEDENVDELVYLMEIDSEGYAFDETVQEKLDSGEYALPYVEIFVTDRTEIVDFVDFNEEGYDPYTTVNFNNDERSLVKDYLKEQYGTISVKLGDGSIHDIQAKWQCMDDIEETEYDMYAYELVIPDGYHLSDELQEKYDNYKIILPFINVNINFGNKDGRASLTRYYLVRDGSSKNYMYLFAYISSPNGTQKVYAGPQGSVTLNNMTAGSWTYNGLSYNYMYAIPIVSGNYGLYCFNISLNGTTNAGRVNFVAGNAKIGSTYYNTMADAVAAASNGATIELLKGDCREYDYSYLANKTVTIKPSTYNAYDFVYSGTTYTATVRNSGEAVTVNLPTKDGQTFFIRNHTGTLTLSGNGSYNLNFNGANLSDPNTSQEDPVYAAVVTLASANSYATTTIKSGVNIYNVGKGTGDGYGVSSGDASVKNANITVNIESGVNIYNNSTGVGGSGTLNISGGNFYSNSKDGALVIADNASTACNITGGSFYSNGARGIAFGNLESLSAENHNATISSATIRNNGTYGVYFSSSATELWNSSLISNNIYSNATGVYINKAGIVRFYSGNIYSNTVSGVGVFTGVFEMSGGSIYSNSSTGRGGGVFNLDTFNFYGGTIYDNTATTYGSGVYQGGTMNMKGSAVVNADNDVYLPSGKYITVNGALTGTATITPDTYTRYRICVRDSYSGKGSTYLSNFTLTPNGNYCFIAGDTVQDSQNVADSDIVISNTYTITYDANGGTGAPGSQSYVYGGPNINLSSTKPTWANHDFLGWSLDSTATTKSYDPGQAWGSTNGANYTLYAVWKEADYTITYDENGGSAVSNQTYNITTNVTLSAAPTRTGYTFKGWKLATAVNNWSATTYSASQNIGTGKYGNITLVAQWSPVSYKITYDENGGSTVTDLNYNIETNVTLSAAPTKTGHTFTGWKLSSAVGNWSATSYDASKNIGTGKYGNITLVAQWSANEYTVSYNANGGSGTMSTDTIKYGEAYTAKENAFTRDGYTFSSWNEKADGTGSSWAGYIGKPWTWTYTKSITLYAQWTPNIIKVTLDNQSATTAGTPAYWYQYKTTKVINGETVYYYTNSTCTSPLSGYTITKPTKTGYTFGGYWTGKNGTGTQYVNASGQCINNLYNVVSSDLTLYAQWTPNTYKVTLDNQSATTAGTPAYWYQYKTTKVINGATTYYYTNSGCTTPLSGSKITVPTKTGYTFGGYWTGKNGTGTQYVNASGGCINNLYASVAADTTLYAKWTINSYDLKIDPNGGYRASDGSTSVITVNKNYGATENISERKRTGYTLTGYTMKNTSSGSTTDLGGATFTFDSATKTGTFKQGTVPITLVAQWKINTYTAKFDPNGGYRVSDNNYNVVSYDYNYGATDGISERRKEGHTLTGYVITNTASGSTTDIGGATVTFDSSTKTGTFKQGSVNVTITAQWKVNQYTATFDSNGGSEANPKTITKNYNEALGTLPSTSRTGYTFNGWYTAASGGTQITSTTKMPAKNITYYAQWTANKYTLSYDANGGSGAPESQDWTYGGTAITVSNTEPTRKGYTFKGWAESSTATTAAYAGGDTISSTKWSSNKTLYAVWSLNNYTITYDLDGGSLPSGKTNPTSYNVNTATFTLNNPTKTGYTFAGWTGSNGSTPQTSVSIAKGSTGNKTYTAKWTLNTYTITYDLDGGSLPSGKTNPTSYNVNTATFTLNNPTKTGYTFTGWTGSNGSTPQTSVSIAKGSTGNKSYKANFEINSYTATFDANGGSEANPKTITKNYNEALGTLPSTSRTGYTFLGWYTAESGGTQISTTTKLIGNVTYYAHWSEIEYTIKYKENGGSAVSDQTYYITTDVTLEAAPTKTGYTFAGWELDNAVNNWEAKTYSASQKIGTGKYGNIELDAQWTANEYTLSYDANGGSNAPSSQKWTYDGTDITVSIGVPTRKGYTFIGWAETSTATTAEYIGGNTISSTKWATDKTLYAVWKINSYTIKYDANGGTGTAIADQTVTYGSQVTIKENTYQKAGHRFVGWSTKKDNTDDGYNWTGWSGTWEYVDGQKGISDKTLTLYARWSTDAYIITYDLDGGSLPDGKTNPTSYAVTTETFTLNNPTKEGCTFLGWTGSNGSTPQTSVSITKGSTGNKNYTANWEANSYTATFDANGGSEANPKTITKKYNEALGTLPTTSRAGYTFDGWYTLETGGTQITADTKMPPRNVTYYAHWSAIKYTITYNENGGSAVSDQNYYITTDVTLEAAPSKTGYTFAGWKLATAVNNWEAKTYSASQNIGTGKYGSITLVAQWKANTNTKYVVNHFQMDTSGKYPTTATETESKEGTTGATLTLTNLKKSYTGFTYKYGQVDGSTETTTEIKADGSTVINLYYARDTHTVTLNKGTGISSVSGAGTYYYGESVTINASVSTGYEWKNWTGEETTATQKYTFTMGTSDVSYTANATAIKYTITYNENGGSAVSDQNYYITTDVTLEAAPTKTGYTFAGWELDKSVNNWEAKTYSASQKIGTGKYGNITLVAQWTPITIDVTFHRNSSSSDTTTATQTFTYDVGGQKFSDKGWSLTDKIIIGWSVDPSATTATYSLLSNVTNDWINTNAPSIDLYAVWCEKEVFAVYSEEDHSLRFYYDIVPSVGDTYNDLTVTAVYTGIEELKAIDEPDVPWYTDYASEILKVVAEDEIKPISTRYWFYDLRNCSSFDLRKMNTSNVTDMSQMFYYAGYNTDTFELLGLSEWDTSKVTDMSWMLSNTGYKASTFSLDLSKWNTSLVEDMSGMFKSNGYSADIWSIGDLSTKKVTLADGTTYTAWNTSKVENMSQMFGSAGRNADTWSVGNLSNWNTSSVKKMNLMFDSAGRGSSVFELGDLSTKTVTVNGESYVAWNTSSVEDMSAMFQSAGRSADSFVLIGLGTWNTSKVDDMSNMFYAAGRSAETWSIGDLSSKNMTVGSLSYASWDTSKVEDMHGMFYEAGYYAEEFALIGLNTWNTSLVEDMGATFQYAGYNSEPWSLDLSSWSTESVTTMESMFNGCRTLEEITLGVNFDFVGTNGYLPVPNASNLPGTDGHWHNVSTYETYSAPSDVHADETVVSTYTVYPHKYTVIFNANGGSGTMEDLEVIYNVSTSLTENVFTRTGYNFNGWNTASNGSGTTYTDKASVLNIASPDETITLYAQWTINQYTATFDANGGTTPTPSDKIMKNYNEELGTLPTTTRTGYTFDGWFTAKTDGTIITAETKVTGDVTYYAQWTEIARYAYVNGINGDDNNNGLTPEKAVKTFKKAYENLGKMGGTIYVVDTVTLEENVTLHKTYYQDSSVKVEIANGYEVNIKRYAQPTDFSNLSGFKVASNTNSMIYIPETITLTLNAIVIDGHNTDVSEGKTQFIAEGVDSLHPMLENYGTLDVLLGTVLQNNTNISSETGDIFGGAIYNKGTVNITDSEILNNSGHEGGGVYQQLGTTNVNGSLIHDNTATGESGGSGGAFEINTGNLYISDSEIYNNTANLYGGAIDHNYHGDFTITNSKIYKNKTLTYSGGAIMIGNYVELEIKDGEIYDNTAKEYGGAIYAFGGTLKVTGGKIYKNNAVQGGAIYNNGDTYISGGEITSNTAKTYGGAIYNKDMLEVSGGTISDNIASVYGEGVYQNGTMNVKADAAISINNDVYLPANKYITVIDALSMNNVAMITPDVYTNGRTVVRTDYPESGSTLASVVNDKFLLTPEEDFLLRPGDYVDDSIGILDTDVIISKPYSVTYNKNTEDTVSNLPTPITGYWNEATALSDTTPSRTSYDFINWNTVADNSGTSFANGENILLTENITLYAQWKRMAYSITYALDETAGEKNHPDNPSEYVYGIGVDKFFEPTKPGYEFNGWYAEPEFKNPVTSISADHTGDITLYPKWSQMLMLIYHNNLEGEDKETKTVVISEADCESGYAIPKNAQFTDFEKQDAVFGGWDKDKTVAAYNASYPAKELPKTVSFDVLKAISESQPQELPDSLPAATLYAIWDLAPIVQPSNPDEDEPNKPKEPIVFYEGEEVTGKELLDLVKAQDNEDNNDGDDTTNTTVRITKISYSEGKLIDGVESPAYEISYSDGMKEDELLDTWFLQMSDDPGKVDHVITYEAKDSSGNITIYELVVSVKYNEFPVIVAEDRYFTLDEARNGLITEAVLIETGRAWDMEDCEEHCEDNTLDGDNCSKDDEPCDFTKDNLKLLGYNENEFLNFGDDETKVTSGYVTLTYTIKDQFGKESYCSFNVIIADSEEDFSVPTTKYVRFIDEENYAKNIGAKAIVEALPEDEQEQKMKEYNLNGGLRIDSKWYEDAEYSSILTNSFNHSGASTYKASFNHEDVVEIKNYSNVTLDVFMNNCLSSLN